MQLTHLSLFTGIGGLDLAAEWAGFVTVGQCEFADYPTKVLEKHWPDVPKWRDIRTLTGESFYERTGLRTVDVISGGFPCQPFSVAGKQKGKEDDRYLWPEMLRVIRELAPRWIVGENVPGILRIAAADIVKDLEREGYDVVVFGFEAAAVGAPHRRERIAFVGNTNSGTMRDDRNDNWQADREINTPDDAGIHRGEVVSDHDCKRCKEQYFSAEPDEAEGWIGKILAGNSTSEGFSDRRNVSLERSEQIAQPKRPDWWSVEPDVGRVAHGVPHRVDRLKCLGNAVVPRQFYPIFRAIAETEKCKRFEDYKPRKGV